MRVTPFLPEEGEAAQREHPLDPPFFLFLDYYFLRHCRYAGMQQRRGHARMPSGSVRKRMFLPEQIFGNYFMKSF